MDGTSGVGLPFFPRLRSLAAPLASGEWRGLEIPNFWAQGPVALECLLPASFSLLFLIKRALGTKELLSYPKGTRIHFISDSILG